jgi:hypothetical protein
MIDLPAILARSDNHAGEVVFAVIVFIIWGIGALAKLSKTQTEQAKKRQAQLDAAIRAQVEGDRQREAAVVAARQVQRPQEQPRPAMSAPLPSALRKQAARPAQQVPRSQPPRGKQPQRPQQKRRVQMTPPALPLPKPVLEEIPGVVQSEIGRGAVPASPAQRQVASAGPGLRLSPKSLRQLFVLTEVVQPPLALREQSEL